MVKALVFIAGALVGAWYNTVVLAIASACAEGCNKAAALILQWMV